MVVKPGRSGFTIKSKDDLDSEMDKFIKYEGAAILNAFVSSREKPMPRDSISSRLRDMSHQYYVKKSDEKSDKKFGG